MCYRVAVLLLFVVPPMMSVLAAPAPDPYAILDIGPPPKGRKADEHRREEIARLSHPKSTVLMIVSGLPEVRKLPSVAAAKDDCKWLSENLRIAQEREGNRLRFTFRAGTRAEQVVILKALLEVYVHGYERRIQFHEKGLRSHEESIVDLEKRIESRQEPGRVDSYKKEINELRTVDIPACRAEIARLRQIAVIHSAK